MFKWLDDKDFNRIAFSRDGHVQFDGKGRGRGKRPKTTPKATLQPMFPADGFFRRAINRRDFVVLPINLWCKQKTDADAWLPYLRNGSRVAQLDGRFRITGLSIAFEERRRVTLLYEDDSDGNRAWITAVPGLPDPTAAQTWDRKDNSIAVYEIAWLLLKYQYEDTIKLWALEAF